MKAKNCIKDLKRRERERPSDLQSPRSFAALLAIHVRESERNSKKEKERKFKRPEEIFFCRNSNKILQHFPFGQIVGSHRTYLSPSSPVDSITFWVQIRIWFLLQRHLRPELLKLYRNSDQRYSNLLYSAFVFGSKHSQFLRRLCFSFYVWNSGHVLQILLCFSFLMEILVAGLLQDLKFQMTVFQVELPEEGFSRKSLKGFSRKSLEWFSWTFFKRRVWSCLQKLKSFSEKVNAPPIFSWRRNLSENIVLHK